MGQAFDSGDHFLGEVRGDSFRDVLDKLELKHPHAAKVVIGHGEPPAATTEMPKYRCHKDVWALKIRAVTHNSVLAQLSGNESDGSAVITPDDEGYGDFRVDAAYLRKHDPQPGGYYVVYADGYQSYSPAEPFESGYTRI